MITPTNGRIVWYTPYESEIFGPDGMATQRDKDGGIIPLAAQICAVWDDRMVNLLVTDANGKTFSATSRTLLQDDDPRSVGGGYCEWMPFQKGQAVALEKKQAASG